jgi:hypothetical protein
MMVAELIRKDEWQPLQEGRDEEFPDPSEVREEEVLRYASEMIDEPREDYTEEQRQNLHQKISAMSTPEKLRLAILANREARGLLIHDPKKVIALTVLKNRKITESEIVRFAQRKDLSEDVISAIAKDQKWHRHYPVKFAVATNPKAPIPAALNLLPQLHERDLRTMSRDKNLAAVLRRKAHELCTPKNGK